MHMYPAGLDLVWVFSYSHILLMRTGTFKGLKSHDELSHLRLYKKGAIAQPVTAKLYFYAM